MKEGDRLFKIAWGGVFAQCRLILLDEDWMMLTDVYVHPWIRGKGHSHTVLKKAIAYADRKGVNLMLKVKRYGKGGLRDSQLSALYGQYGFVVYKSVMIRRAECHTQRSKRLQGSKPQTARNMRCSKPQRIIKEVLMS